MATYYSRTSGSPGNWAVNGTWSTTSHAGVAAGAYPVAGDIAYIGGNCVVTIAAAAAIRTLYIGGSDDSLGTLAINADLTFDDNAASAMIIKAGAANAVTNNGTASTPRTIKSASSSPTDKWFITYYKQDTVPDTRSLNFNYVQFTGNLWYIGNSTYSVNFNAGTANAPFILDAPPLSRAPKIDNHFIEGRATSRIYPQGSWAGTVPINGRVLLSGFTWQTLNDLVASKQRFAFFSQYCIIPHCRFDQEIRYTPIRGSKYVKFSAVLIEDK